MKMVQKEKQNYKKKIRYGKVFNIRNTGPSQKELTLLREK